MGHPISNIVKRYKNGEEVGIFSVCCSNQYVIEAAMERLKDTSMHLLIESTANQVDQFGGYTGMKPKDYINYIYDLAEKNEFPKERIILGGDHLGPLTWTNLDEETAMENSKNLIREYVLAGFTKIHIDTSMMIKGDLERGDFGDEVIAKRAAILCKVAEDAYKDLLKEDKNAIHPVYVIGSEVPIPGGAQAEEEEEDTIQVTKVENFKNTVETFEKAFVQLGLEDALNYVTGIVVQPGVEFGSDIVFEYNRDAAKELSEAIKSYDNLVFEAHSTDYQTKDSLKKMVQDGYIILKVGPALTFGFREGAFSLNEMENELLKYRPDLETSRFMDILEFNMVKNPKDWIKHYSGSNEKIKFDRIYSLSDRCRYYMPKDDVNFALERMLDNLNEVDIPITLVSQFMHNQYKKVREGKLKLEARDLLKDRIGEYIDDYIFAVNSN
ncbi:MAG: class II D-tagatose-bisphosphate aldolase non-catalytic subunit [Clostridium sp.]|uniref:class II D-tagatose-bisphosphate aldolase non-catalytic subunit n=1 Tax=Clostridium sp. TaxID=1506 RepID=UPI003F4006E3